MNFQNCHFNKKFIHKIQQNNFNINYPGLWRFMSSNGLKHLNLVFDLF